MHDLVMDSMLEFNGCAENGAREYSVTTNLIRICNGLPKEEERNFTKEMKPL